MLRKHHTDDKMADLAANVWSRWNYMGLKSYKALASGFGLVGALATFCKAALAAPVANCAGAVMMGAAALLCNHTDPQQPAQICTYSWALMTTDGVAKVVDGSFLIGPGTSNLQVYSASGFGTQLSGPIVMCRANATAK